MPATIRDIAVRVGLSNQAVSYALRGEGRLADKTRQRVLEVAAQLGYRPHRMARAVRSGRNGNVGLLLSTVGTRSYLPGALLDGVESALSQRDLHLIIGRLPDEQLSRHGALPAVLEQWSADGLLVNYQQHIPTAVLERIRQEPVPIVWINNAQEGASVVADDLQAGKDATRHLLSLGHRRIAYIDYSHGIDDLPEAHYSVRHRQAGYESAMQQAGLTPRVIRANKTVVSKARLEACKQWLLAADRPTAVIGYGSTTVVPIMFQALISGLSVPGDLSLISFDDNPATQLGRTLTTMQLPLKRMGEESVDMLLERIVDPSRSGELREVPFMFFPGETCAPPAEPHQAKSLDAMKEVPG
jgi:LacI family transcriptional regulator